MTISVQNIFSLARFVWSKLAQNGQISRTQNFLIFHYFHVSGFIHGLRGERPMSEES